MTSDLRADSGLPDFVNPPVDEVALSIQFPTVKGLAVPHYGLLFHRIREDYPRFEVQPPIANVVENLASRSKGGRAGIQLLTEPQVRCWFMDRSENYLIQVQNDRFVCNWRKVRGDEAYPRYPLLRERLEKEWARFCTFLADEGFTEPQVNQCEVTYVNHIEYDKGWHGFGELGKVIESYSIPSASRFLPVPEQVSMQVAYRIEDRGRLHVSFKPVIRGMDAKEVLQLTLTARGAPSSSSTESALAWLDLGRKWVVRGFADFTNNNMHKIWEKK